MAPDALGSQRKCRTLFLVKRACITNRCCQLKGEKIWWLKQGTRGLWKVLPSLG